MKDIQGYYMLDGRVYLSVRSALILFVTFIVTIGYLFWSPYTEASAWVSPHTRTSNGYLGDFSWPTEESDMVICNAADCSVAVCHYSATASEKCVNPSATSSRVVIPRNATVKDARIAFVNKNGNSGNWSTVTQVLYDPSTCFGILYWQGSNNGNYTGLVIPGSYCGKPPPPTTKCELMGDVVFDYGSISAGAVQGSSKTEYINVQCSATANIIITLVGERSITLGGGIASKLFINDTDLSTGAKISVSQGSQSFPITSTLSSDAKPIAGNYSGSGVVVLGYQ